MNQIKSSRALTLIFSLLLIPFSCLKGIHHSTNRDNALASEAIFKYLEQPNAFLDEALTKKGKSMIDPLLACRGRLEVNGKAYFETPIRCDLLAVPATPKNGRLLIPDSLTYKYTYTDSADTDYEHDYSIIFQFSPLLPTNEPGIYLMEYYVWGSGCDAGYLCCARVLSRQYLKFKVEKTGVSFLKEVSIKSGDVDFIGLGGFSWKAFEQAKPGEKIRKFGC